jgi:hypothetical protein
MSERATVPPNQNDEATDPHVESVLTAIKALMGPLPTDERARILGELTKAFRPIPQPRAGATDLLGEVVRLLPEQRSWRVDDVRRRIEERGIEAEPKAVYNALGYLKRKGWIQHDGYGRYTVEGVHFVTSDEVGGMKARSEIDDT